ncbi:MAG: hypothetical protein K6A72_10780 [Lachnospiraceae bacterium]|nr:hypothetical protein [Lachnospiraceae bacterium]
MGETLKYDDEKFEAMLERICILAAKMDDAEAMSLSDHEGSTDEDHAAIPDDDYEADPVFRDFLDSELSEKTKEFMVAAGIEEWRYAEAANYAFTYVQAYPDADFNKVFVDRLEPHVLMVTGISHM